MPQKIDPRLFAGMMEDGPPFFGTTLETWMRHLEQMRALPDQSLAKAGLIERAEMGIRFAQEELMRTAVRTAVEKSATVAAG